jgi:hypothetical protein
MLIGERRNERRNHANENHEPKQGDKGCMNLTFFWGVFIAGADGDCIGNRASRVLDVCKPGN